MSGSNAKQFNPKELAAANRALFTKVHPSFGKIVYGKVTASEVDEISKKAGADKTLKALIPLNQYALASNAGGGNYEFNGPYIVVQGSMDKAVADYAVQKVKEMLKSVFVEPTSSGAPAIHRRLRIGGVSP